MAALMLLYVLALDSYTRLWPEYNAPKFLHLRKEWDWIFWIFLKLQTRYFSHTNSKVHAVCVLNRRPLAYSTPCLAHTQMLYPALKLKCSTSQTMTIWTWDHLHMLQLLLHSPFPLHLPCIFLSPFVFPYSVHICSMQPHFNSFHFSFAFLSLVN